MSTISTAQAPAAGKLDGAARKVISLLLVSAFVVILNETIMSVAVPELMADLAITASSAQWLSTAFMLTMAIVIPVTGFLIERFSTRTLFALAMTLFSCGTLIGGLAPGFEVLLAARVVQACGTAIMMPLLMTTVMNLVPAHQRGRVMGNITIVIAVAPALGPTVSGAVLSLLDWRWLFWLVLPIAVLGLLLGLALIKNVTTPRKIPIDVVSVILSALAFGGLIYGLSSLGEAAAGNAAISPVVPLAAGLAALALFVVRQLALQRSDRALLDLRTFAAGGFTVSLLIMLATMMALFGAIIVLPIYLQTVLGLAPVLVGLTMLPGSLLMGLLGPVIGRLFDRLGARPLVIPGAVLVTLVMASLSLVSAVTPVALVVVAHIVLSLGLGMLMTPLFTTSLSSLPQRLYSHGSAVVGTLQQVAAAAGTALFITVFTAISAGQGSRGAEEVEAVAGGVRAAFACGTAVALAAVVLAVFLLRPAPAAQTDAEGPVTSAPLP